MKSATVVGVCLALLGTAAAAAPVTRAVKRRKNEMEKLQQLLAIMPHLSSLRAYTMVPYLIAAEKEFGLTSRRREAAFLAQVAHESGELRYWKELADGRAYGPSVNPSLAAKLGNRTDAEAMLYVGRSPLQVTGHYNYERMGQKLGLPLLEHPDLLEQPEHGFRASALFWQEHGLNELADVGTPEAFRETTRRINGGYNGLAQREAYWQRAKVVLGVGGVA